MSTRRNSTLFFEGLLCIGLFLLHCTNSPLEMAGGASGTEVSLVTGSAITFDGNPVNAASVVLRPADFLFDSASSPTYINSHTMLDTLTNSSGAFTFRSVRPDTYCVVVSYQDSVAVAIPFRIDSNVASYHLKPYTVFPMATISGTISIVDSSITLGTVQLYGTNFRFMPDNYGQFSLKIPEGNSKIHIGAFEPDSYGTRELDGMDISVSVAYGQTKNIGTILLQPPPPAPCLDGSCDSMVVRNVLNSVGQGAADIGRVSVAQNGRIVELSLRGITLNNSRIPPEIFNLMALKKLDLGHTGITSVFPALTIMRNLEVLLLDSNACTMLPFDIGKLTILKELNISTNELTILPPSIINIRQVTNLDLSNNRLYQLDTTIAAWADQYDPDWRQTQRVTQP